MSTGSDNGMTSQVQPTAAFLTALLDSINDGVIVADLDGRFLIFNAAARRILGQGPLQVPISKWTASYGAFLDDMVTPYPPERLPLARALRGETVAESSVFIRNGDESDGVWLSINASPLRGDAGEVTGGVIVFRDVTASRRELERVRFLSTVVEQTADAVIVTNPRGVVEYVNPAVERVTGFQPADMIGKTPQVLKSGLHSDEFYSQMWSTLLRGEVFRGTLINRKKASREVYYSEQTITPIVDSAGRISSFVSVGKDLTEMRRSLERDQKLRLARSVQQRMHPAAPPGICGFDVAGSAFMADETGGDYYDFLSLPDGCLGLAVGDVSGHGFDTALVMVQTRAALRTIAGSHTDPGLILAQMNANLLTEVAEAQYVTLVLACLNAQTRTMHYSSAGHTTGYLLSACGDIKREITSTGVPLGLFPEQVYESVVAPDLQRGDVLALITDGISESFTRDDVPFGSLGALEVIRRHIHEPAAEIVNHVYRAAREFCDGPQCDDMTAVVCKVGDCA
ncbi:MAG: SpoIIE family protein phosphatase [Acidobacteria bacterium]|nr:SpoIIE family protein phosphatase [Acidobacteriota bacterium]